MKITKTPLGSTLIILCVVFSLFAYPSAAHAAGTVGTGTPASCTEAALDTALTGGGAVDFNCGAAPHTIVISTTKNIAANTSIDGGGLITISGGNAVQIFDVQAGFTLNITRINLVNGNSGTVQQGGAIYINSGAIVTITDSTISNNTSAFNGVPLGIAAGAGAIHNAGNLTIVGSTISGNSATGDSADGGAIYTDGTISISNSTFYNNSANPTSPGSTGGAIRINGGTATLTHVTISDNRNDTVASTYGAIDIGGGNVTIIRSILANSANGVDCTDRTGSATSTDNLIENDSGTWPCLATVTGDPALGALQDNGGPTQTMALETSPVISPAIDAGGAACGVATDQRGVTRPQPAGGNCDIGAFEVDNTAPTVTINQAGGQADPTKDSPINFTVVFSEPVTGFANGDVSLSSGTPLVTGGPTTYNVAVSGMSQGVLTATVPAGGATDIAGNSNAASTSTDNTVTYDNIGPTVTINQAAAQADPTNASPINFTVVFSESVTGFDNTDVTLSSGTPVVTGSGTTYNVAVSGMSPGVLTATVNAGAVTDSLGNNSSASTSTDNSVTFTVTVAPLITSANNTTFNIGAAGTFTVTTSGYPIPALSHTAGALPTGVTFTDNGDGTATLAGTPASGTANVYSLTFVASNGVNPDDSQTFTLTVTEAPAFTSADNTAFSIGNDGSFTITTSGSPTVSKITIGGDALPANVIFTDNGNGTATLSGIPQTGTAGPYAIFFIASNGVGADARQDFNLTINQAPPPMIAVDGIGSVPDSGGGFIAEAETVSVGITTLLVTFDQDVRDAGAADPDSVTNPANYILVQDNGDGIQTTTCAPGGGVIGGDIAIPINSVTYNNGGGSGPFVATVNLNGGVALVEGAYRLIVCGTTSIVNQFAVALAGDGVNPGTDFTRNFVIAFGATATGRGGSTDAKTLPATGFPMGVITDLPAQPASKAYAAYGDLWLEVPKLKLKMSIVGVPQTEGSWDVTWLGKDAGYLQGTAFPTWEGNTVLTAHVWDAFNNPGPFAGIKNLLYGDQVKIHAFGQVYTYEVRESRLISSRNIRSALKHENLDWVTLLTCEDYSAKYMNYSYRRAVRAVLISVMAEK